MDDGDRDIYMCFSFDNRISISLIVLGDTSYLNSFIEIARLQIVLRFSNRNMSFETVHWKYRHIAHLIESHTYAILHVVSYYKDSWGVSWFVIAHEIAVRMRNHWGLCSANTLLVEPKVAFSRGCDGRRCGVAAMMAMVVCCDTSVVRGYNAARCKKGKAYFEGTETRKAFLAHCVAQSLNEPC